MSLIATLFQVKIFISDRSMQLFQVKIFSDRSRSRTQSNAPVPSDQLVINLVLTQPLFLFIPLFTRNE